MLFAPIIISKWLFSSISQRSHCSADSKLTCKSSVIMASPFLFYSFLHNALSFDALIYALNMTSLCVLENSVGSSSLRLSLAQYIHDVNSFFWTRVTVNLRAAVVLLEYSLQADCIPSASSTLRWPIPSGSIIMSSQILSLARNLLMPNTANISMVVNGTVAVVSLLKELIKLIGLINCIILMIA